MKPSTEFARTVASSRLFQSIQFVAVSLLWLFLTVPLVGLQCVIVVFPDHKDLLFSNAE